jgi:hypothetical protein
MPNEIQRVKCFVAGGGNCKHINYRNAGPVRITFCEEFLDLAHESLLLEGTGRKLDRL